VGQPLTKSLGGFAQEGRKTELPVEEGAPLPIPLNPKVMQQSRLQEVPPEEPTPAAPGRMIPGSYNGPVTEVPKSTRFQKPISAGANPEELLKQLQAEEAERDAREKALEKLNDQTRRDSGESTKAEAKSKDTPSKSAKKPVKIDEKLMEKLILQRNSGG